MTSCGDITVSVFIGQKECISTDAKEVMATIAEYIWATKRL